MSKRFPHLLEPIRIGNHILKSRMIAPQALPHYLQGSEPYPGDATIAHVSNIARNGAAIVAFGAWDDTDQRKARLEQPVIFPCLTILIPPMRHMCASWWIVFIFMILWHPST